MWPQREHSRLGIKTGMPLDGLNPEVEAPLRRDLEVFARAQPGVVDDHTRLVLKPGWGRTDSHVIQLAIDEDQDVDESDEVVVAEAISAGPFEDGVVRFEVAIVDGAELVVGDPAALVDSDGLSTWSGELL